MSSRRGSRCGLVVAGVVTLALIAGCTSHGHESPGGVRSDAVTVRVGRATTVHGPGVLVRLPVGGARPGSTVSVKVSEVGVVDAAAGLVPLSGAVHVALSARLRKPARLVFPAPAQLSSRMLPAVVWQDDKGGWQLLPTRWRPGAEVVSATTPHFSSGFLAGVDVDKLAHEAMESFKGFLSGRSRVPAPACANQAAARAGGIRVTSDRGDTIKWCIGLEGGHRVLRLANNRRTFTSVRFPASWEVVDGNSLSFSTETVARAFGTWVSSTLGVHARIIDGGDTLTLRIPDGASGAVEAEMSEGAWAVSALFFAASVYGRVATALDNAVGKKAASTNSILEKVLTGRGENETYGALRQCTEKMGPLSDDPVDDNRFWSLSKMMFGCGPAVMKAELKTGIGFWAAKVLDAISAAVSAVLTAAHLLITGVRELYDDVASFGGKSDPDYNIVIQQPEQQYSLGDGSYYGYVKSLTAAGLTFDLVQWFTGPAAAAACREDGVKRKYDEQCNDYYISNKNALLRTLPLASAKFLMPSEPGGFENEPTTRTAMEQRIAELRGQFLAHIAVLRGRVTSVQYIYRP